MTPRKLSERRQRFIPGGVPSFIRCYDNGGESADRYTVVFTGRYRHLTGGEFCYRSMSACPFHPQGVGIWGGHTQQIDVNRWGFAPPVGRKCRLGQRIKFEELPEDCQALTVSDYCELWSLGLPEPPAGIDREEFDAKYLAEMRSYARQKPCGSI